MAGLLSLIGTYNMMCRYLLAFKIKRGRHGLGEHTSKQCSGEAQSPTDTNALNCINEHGGKTGPPAGRCFCRAP